MICTVCGAELPDDATVCDVCSSPVELAGESTETPVISTEEKMLPFPAEDGAFCESAPVRDTAPPAPESVGTPAESENKTPSVGRRARRRVLSVVSLFLIAAACAAAFYPVCRDFGVICTKVADAVDTRDVLPVEGMLSVSLVVLAAFAADFALSLKNALYLPEKPSVFAFSFVILLAAWGFARLNETPARFVQESRILNALLSGCGLFAVKDYSLMALVLLALAVCARVAARKGNAVAA